MQTGVKLSLYLNYYLPRNLLFLAFSLSFLLLQTLADYRSGFNLGVVQVRCRGAEQESSVRADVRCLTPWGSTVTMKRGQRGIWHVPSYGCPAVQEIRVVEDPGAGLSASSWEISVNRGYSPDWQRCSTVREEGYFRIVPEAPVAGSLLPAYKNVLNWQGDLSLVSMAFLKTAAWLLMVCIALEVVGQVASRVDMTASFWAYGHLFLPDVPATLSRSACWLLTGFLISFGILGLRQCLLTMSPGIHEDGCLWVNNIVHRAAGEGSLISSYTRILGPEGKATKFGLHGQVYTEFISLFVGEPDYAPVLAALNWLNIYGFVVAVLSAALVLGKRLSLAAHLSTLCALPIGFSTVAVMHYLQGRPEHLIPPLLLTLVALGVFVGKWAHEGLLDGLCIGVVGAVSPLPGLVLASAKLFCCGLGESSPSVYLRRGIVRGAYAVVVWLLCTSFSSDESPLEMVLGILSEGQGVYGGVWSPSAIPVYWWDLPLAPYLGSIFLIGVIISAVAMCKALRGQRSWLCRLMLLLSLVPIVKYAWSNAICFAGFNYCFLGFMPTLGLWCLVCTISAERLLPTLLTGGWGGKVLRGIIFAGMISASFGSVRTFLLQPIVEGFGVSYWEARDRVKVLSASLRPNEFVMIDAYAHSRSAIVLDGFPSVFRTRLATVGETEKKLQMKAKFYVVLQNTDTPPHRDGFKLAENHFVSDPVFRFGRALCGFTPGYGFAIYERALSE